MTNHTSDLSAPVERQQSAQPHDQPKINALGGPPAVIENENKGIKITRKPSRSAYTGAMHHLIKPFKRKITEITEAQPAGSVELTPPRKALEKVDVDERIVEGIRLYDMHPKDWRKDPDMRRRLAPRRLYYFCGGGWQSIPSDDHWSLISAIARSLPDVSVTMVSYPLAPNSAAPVAFPQLLKLYHTLLRNAEEANENVMFGGDSAGGNIVLAVTLAALKDDKDCRCPSAILAISPSTDLRRQNPDMLEVEKHDPILSIEFVKSTANAWRGEWDASDPRLSPLLADVRPLATRGVYLIGVTGRYDILGPDAILFRDMCVEAGVQGEWLEWEKQMHCFPLAYAYKLPESMEAKDWIIDALRRCP